MCCNSPVALPENTPAENNRLFDRPDCLQQHTGVCLGQSMQGVPNKQDHVHLQEDILLVRLL